MELDFHSAAKNLPDIEMITVADDVNVFAVKGGEYAGISYIYEDIAIREADGGLVLHFTYLILDGDVSHERRDEFKAFIGDVLTKLIQESLGD